MRIIIAGINYAPEPTGIGRYTGEMGSWLAARGHDVTVIAAPPHYPAWKLPRSYRGRGFVRETIDGVTVLRTPVILPRSQQVSTIARIVLESSFTLAAARWWFPRLFGAKPDVAIAVTPPLQDAVWPLLYGLVRRVPTLVHVQDLQVDAAVRLGLLDGGVSSRVLYAIEKRTLRRATAVSTITGAMLERVRSKGVDPARSFVFPNWSDLSAITPRSPDPAMRHALGAGPSDTLVLYSGNLGHKQGLDVVLEAAAATRDQARLRYAIVGDGAARAELVRRAEELNLTNLAFHDVVPADELAELLAAGDVHLVVQKEEAADLVMPSKLTNILAAGRPAIATAAPGTELHDVLTAHGLGVAVPPGDAEALRSAIVSYAGDAELQRESGARARRYAESHLDRDRILEAFAGRLERIAEGDPRVQS